MTREHISLDGDWQLVLDPQTELQPEQVSQARGIPVRVPAPWQSQSEELRDYTGAAWYVRRFDAPHLEPGQRWILGFGAVDYLADVWVNSQPVGSHEGGYLPFELDVSAQLRAGENVLLVRVDDPPELFAEIPHGKQSWYGLLSGIWQPVWLESRPGQHIVRVKVTPDARSRQVALEARLSQREDALVRWEILDPDGALVAALEQAGPVVLPVTAPRLWDLDTPVLYTARASLPAGGDTYETVFGFRTFEARGGKLWLNDRLLFLRGALDQDYYPDLSSTAPDAAEIEDQFRKAKSMGLNCLRIHIKVADPRYYDAADRLGLLLWTELPNFETLTPESSRRARETLVGMVDRDWNHPSIVIWTVVNESWGVDLTLPEHRQWVQEMYDFLKQLDPNRLVVGNSACEGNNHIVSDIADFHNYYDMPDHYRKWRRWVNQFSRRPAWIYASAYQGYSHWRKFLLEPWRLRETTISAEARWSGDEPLVISEFGNWGLPDVDRLKAYYQGEPWWFETGHEWSEGVVLPHGIERRFQDFKLHRAFPTLKDLSLASQDLQFDALKFEIEQIRLRPSLAGYIITEFTDVNWECNGLLDLLRQPKAHFQRLEQINADDMILPIWRRLAYRSGETISLPISYAHYAPGSLRRCRLAWRLEGAGDPIEGELKGLAPKEANVSALGTISFPAPQVAQPARARLHMQLLTAGGKVAATSTLELAIFPQSALESAGVRVFAPDLEALLAPLGITLVDRLDEASVVVAAELTDSLREYLAEGGRVVFLAEHKGSLKTYLGKIKIKERKNKPWQGDWANSLSWVYQDQLFHHLPTNGLVDFVFADLTPDVVISGLTLSDYACQVHAALAVGWLHRTAALVAERRIGQGRLLISTFQLRKNLPANPLAAVLLDQMIAFVAR